MTEDSKLDGEQEHSGTGTQQMIELMEAEIERLKVSLELARSGDLPNRRALIKQHVGRIDERQDALDKLRSLQQAANSGN